jgi:hypothetical protein
VHILVIALCLAAFGFAIAAERRRSTVLNTLPQVASCSSFASRIRKPASILQAPCAARARGDLGLDFNACIEDFLLFGLTGRVLRLAFF